MESSEPREHESRSDIYLPAKIYGGMAVGLALMGGVENCTPLNEAAIPTWIAAGSVALGAGACAMYAFFKTKRQ